MKQELLCEVLPTGVYHFEDFLSEVQQRLLVEVVRDIVRAAPLWTPSAGYGGEHTFQTTSCGAFGWNSNESRGVFYMRQHPTLGRPFPAIPVEIEQMVGQVVSVARIPGFVPDSCQINHLRADGRWPSHVDDRERERDAPVLILAVGNTARLSIRGDRDEGELADIELASGDAAILAGPARRLRYGFVEVMPGTSDLVRDDGHISIISRRVG